MYFTGYITDSFAPTKHYDKKKNNNNSTESGVQPAREKVLFCLICGFIFVCLFVLGFYGPVNNEVMSSRSADSGTVPGQA